MRDETEGGTAERDPKGAEDRAQDRTEGYVKWFDEVRGFGFIGREGESDLFVHASAVEAEGAGEALRRGERVTFRVAEGPRGLQARQVRRR